MAVFYASATDLATGVTNISVFVGAEVKTCDNTHPNFEEIKERAKNGDESVLELFDIAETVAQHFDALTERVAIAGGQVYFDGDLVDNALTAQIVRFLNEDVEDWEPLVEFMENVAQNPNEHSREQLYDWLSGRNFTITDGGYIIAYKGVNSDYTSIHAGPGIVNGEAVKGHLDNSPGNIVEIARSAVAHDPGAGCASGLHVGTHAFALSFSRGTVLKVAVNPRDVVSVPTDCNAQKMRVCRYSVLDVASAPVSSAYDAIDNDWDEEEVYCGCECY